MNVVTKTRYLHRDISDNNILLRWGPGKLYDGVYGLGLLGDWDLYTPMDDTTQRQSYRTVSCPFKSIYYP
jgi:hypothetical protein